jgi:hypothetical protein
MTSRRNFLRQSALGAGALALPASFGAPLGSTPPKRFIFIRKSNGIRPNEVALPSFTDQEKSLDAKRQPLEVDLDKHELPEWMRPIAAHKANLSILQGLSC